ncbi:DUF1016 N-terminal domain-containing protein [Streptomyces sp. NPDC051684]|uniref:DUF1016 N-terminal domain-containing protein n=1 Tax=Streptomyces sp. NPDC051684 TaxID=3365670 RepID=UPI0037A8C335
MARLATDLKTTFPNQRGFSRSNLMYIQQMARTWPDSIVQQPVGQLPWGEGWSRDRLEQCMAQELHLRRRAATSNFTATVPEDADVVEDITKDPYRLDFLTLDEQHSERQLEDALVEQIVRS